MVHINWRNTNKIDKFCLSLIGIIWVSYLLLKILVELPLIIINKWQWRRWYKENRLSQ